MSCYHALSVTTTLLVVLPTVGNTSGNIVGATDSSMQITSPEDELAIKDIEKQLLYSTENLPSSSQYFGTGSERHSPDLGELCYIKAWLHRQTSLAF